MRPNRRAPLTIVLSLLAASGALCVVDGCTIVNGLVVPHDASATSMGDARSDAAPAADGGDGCDHALPPPRPAVTDTADDLTVIAVARQILLSTPSGTVAVGYDLDDTCSVDRATETCLGAKPHSDPPRGIDNNAGDLFNLVNGRTDLEKRVNDGIVVGKNSLLVRLGGYNGKADDPRVTVSIYASPGLLDGTGQPQPPQFVDTEAWSLDDGQFNAITDLPTATTDGYVANGTVVAFLDVKIALSNDFSLTFDGAVLTAQLDLTGSKPAITSGVIAGRWPATDILRVVARQRTADGGKALCDDPISYAVAKSIICSDLDIRSDRSSDGKGLACDATSASLRFLGGHASLGSRKAGVPDEPCPTFPSDSCNGDGG
jgi:hypothetical protein